MTQTEAEEISRLKQILEQQSYIALINYDAAKLTNASLQQLFEIVALQSRQNAQLVEIVTDLLNALESKY